MRTIARKTMALSAPALVLSDLVQSPSPFPVRAPEPCRRSAAPSPQEDHRLLSRPFQAAQLHRLYIWNRPPTRTSYALWGFFIGKSRGNDQLHACRTPPYCMRKLHSLVAPGGNLGPCVSRSWMDSCSGAFRAYWSTCGKHRDGWPPRAGNPTGRAPSGQFCRKKETWNPNQKAGKPFGRAPGCDHPPRRSTPIFISPYDRPDRCSSTIHPRMGPSSRPAPLDLEGPAATTGRH